MCQRIVQYPRGFLTFRFVNIIQLERQLNAIYNKEEEERIRKEDAAKENG